MTLIKVDGQEIEVPDHYTLMQACEAAGAEIPRFCYHERLSVAGNCRMCLVEVKGGPPKPAASCAMGVRDLRPGPEGQPPEVFTNTPMVKKAREGVMEFLLINHPLDCPICDQGGECDLQDQAMAYGVDSSRYHENKRAVEDKYIGPLVKTIMTRCIHCTRCVRFTTEVAGISELGLIGRGEDAEITTYLESAMSSELQGNVIDLCPVGALTSRPYAFQARPWELNKTETIDVMDAVGSNIRVDSRGREVMRVMPRVNEAVNEEWISDKTRFIWDGLKSQRLDRPYVKKNKRLQPVSWTEALAAVAKELKGKAGDKVAAIAGDMASVEDMYALKVLMGAMASPNLDCRPAGSVMDPANGRASYIFNPSIAGIEDADALLIIGANPRKEAAVLNARIRKRFRQGPFPIAVIGEGGDLRYDYEHLGTGADAIAKAIDNPPFKAERPLVLVGEGAFTGPDADATVKLAAEAAKKLGAIKDGWNGFGVLHNAASRVGGLDIGFVPGKDGKDTAAIIEGAQAGDIDTVILLGADEIDVNALGEAKVIYVGSHGDAGAHRADLILPAAAYTEQNGTYVNTEGRVQLANRAVFPPGDAKEGWAIFRAISGQLGSPLGFDSMTQLRAALHNDVPHMSGWDEIAIGDPSDIEKLAGKAKPSGAALISPVGDFYLTNPIARASAVMAECSQLALGQKQAAE
ncbi:NADH-quinone oxidoreductase subunit NuoG [Cucumibacter marinus]|uniref:NADH-quinone oxidoreductase subunit NuoG n=1 Tax=Cucumibacter marinus TaxID=1121252 RepID=UPI000423E536|nr:NADH-quinone oxidoreductase subunit NuoG [Cucumibacter marinus]